MTVGPRLGLVSGLLLSSWCVADTIDSVPKQSPGGAQFILGISSLNKGDLVTAQAAFHEVLNVEPNHIGSLLGEADVARRLAPVGVVVGQGADGVGDQGRVAAGPRVLPAGEAILFERVAPPPAIKIDVADQYRDVGALGGVGRAKLLPSRKAELGRSFALPVSGTAPCR